MNQSQKSSLLRRITLLIAVSALLSYAFCLENYLDNYLENPGLKIERCKKFECSCSSPFTVMKVDCPNTKANFCFERGECRMQKNGFCGFTYSKSLRECLTNANYCKIGGWYNELCVRAESKSVQGPNIPRPENVCYKEAKCEVQPTGNCGWTETPKFKRCLKKFMFGC